jgi:Gpi18-like mannosyltransferase
MPDPVKSGRFAHPIKKLVTSDRFLLGSSIALQLILALLFGHAYDTRIFMATGYMVGTGQNPYLAQDVSAIFNNPTFQGITTVGYPPPWSLLLGLIYLCTYSLIPNFLLYNLAIKFPIIIANIGLACLVVHMLKGFGVQEYISRRAWIFLLFNPFILLTSSAWGQFDPIVALLSILSIILISRGKFSVSSFLLALAISLKPIALPLILVVFVYLAGKSLRHTFLYLSVFTVSMFLLCVAPFILLGWDPSPILRHWDTQFTVGGGMSFMTFLEYVKWSYQLPKQWWFLGWLWVPALGIAAYASKQRIHDLKDLLKKSVALVLVFYLCRAWLSETNLNLILPMVLILTSIHELDRRALLAIWVLPLIFSFFNTSVAQLFFPSMPGLMDAMLKTAVEFSIARYAVRTLLVAGWLISGWWVVFQCFRKTPAAPVTILPEMDRMPAE